MESLNDDDYSGMDNGTKVCHFFHGIKSTELEAAVNVVWAKPEKYGADFNAVVSYLSQMVTKKGSTMQSIQIPKTGSQPVKPKVVAFMGKVECKKYSKAVCNSMTREQQMQGIKPTTSQTSTEARIAAHEAQLKISSQPRDGDVKKKEGETPRELAWGRNRGNPVVTCQALGSKCKEPGQLLGSSKGETNASCVDDYESATCANMQTVHLSAHNSLAVVNTKIELDSHVDTFVVGDHCLVVHDHN